MAFYNSMYFHKKSRLYFLFSLFFYISLALLTDSPTEDQFFMWKVFSGIKNGYIRVKDWFLQGEAVPKILTSEELFELVANEEKKRSIKFTQEDKQSIAQKMQIVKAAGYNEDLYKNDFFYNNLYTLKNLEIDAYSSEITTFANSTELYKSLNTAAGVTYELIRTTVDGTIGNGLRILAPDFDSTRYTDLPGINITNYYNFNDTDLLKPYNTKMRIATNRIVAEKNFTIKIPGNSPVPVHCEIIFNLGNAFQTLYPEKFKAAAQNLKNKENILQYLANAYKINPNRLFNYRSAVLPFYEQDFTNNKYILETPSSDTIFGFIAFTDSGLVFHDLEKDKTYEIRFSNQSGYFIRLESKKPRYLNVRSDFVRTLIEINCLYCIELKGKYDPLCVKTVATEAPYLYAFSKLYHTDVEMKNIDIRRIIQATKIFRSFAALNQKNNLSSKKNALTKAGFLNIDKVELEPADKKVTVSAPETPAPVGNNSKNVELMGVNANTDQSQTDAAVPVNGDAAVSAKSGAVDASKSNPVNAVKSDVAKQDDNNEKVEDKKEEKTDALKLQTKDKSSKLSVGKIIAYAIGSVSLVGVAVCGWYIYSRKAVSMD